MNHNETKKLTIRGRASLISAGLLGRKTPEAEKLFEAPPRGVVTIINDCRDDNARGRQEARVTALTGLPTVFIGVPRDIEAAANLIDALDAVENANPDSKNRPKNAILVNIAPRNGEAKKHANGTPFGYFWCGNTVVLSSIDGYTLSLVKKLKLIEQVNVLNIPDALDVLVAEGKLSVSERARIIDTQFRSYEVLPRIAEHLLRKKHIRSTPISIEEIATLPSDYIWEKDIFGNCQTATLDGEIENNDFFRSHGVIKSYPRLKDVPDGVLGIVGGSSGFKDRRFVEIVVQGGKASKRLPDLPREIWTEVIKNLCP